MTAVFRWSQLKSEYVYLLQRNATQYHYLLHVTYTLSLIRPEEVLDRFVKSCLRSAVFLACYVTIGFSTPCAVRPMVEKERHWIYMLTGLVCGSMTMIEARGRQLGNGAC